MSFIKRLRATLVGNLDSVIGQIENQDAVVDAIVRDARQALAKAKVRLNRVDVDGQKMLHDLTQLNTSIEQWTHRAQTTGEQDQIKALACLRQRKECQAQKESLLERLAKHQKMQLRLTADVKNAEGKVREILNKQNIMRTRESTASALHSINAIVSAVGTDLTATFERWELKVTESELINGINDFPAVKNNELEQEYLSQEEEQELRKQLQDLLRGVDSSVNGGQSHE